MANKKQKKDIERAGRVEREAKTNRIITISTIAVVLIALIVVIGGALSEYVFKPNQPIVSINDLEISTGEYQARVKFIRQLYIGVYYQNYQMLEYFSTTGLDGMEELMESYYDQLLSIQSNLDDTEKIGYDVLVDMSDEIVLLSEADKMGITISDEEMELGIQLFFNYSPETDEEFITDDTSEEEISETDAVSEGTDGEDVEPTEVEPQVTPEPTVDPYVEYLDTSETARKQYSKDLGLSEEYFLNFIRNMLIHDKLLEEITKDVSLTGEKMAVRLILVDDVELAEQIIAEFDFYENWEDMETFYAESESENILFAGDLGWISKFDQPALFAAEELYEINQIAGPIMTENGFQVIYVEDIDLEYELSDAEINSRKGVIFDNWLVSVKGDYEILYRDDWISRIPDEPLIPIQFKLQ
jgi:hypothetical protein